MTDIQDSGSRMPYSRPVVRVVAIATEERLLTCGKIVSGVSGCTGNLDKS